DHRGRLGHPDWHAPLDGGGGRRVAGRGGAELPALPDEHRPPAGGHHRPVLTAAARELHLQNVPADGGWLPPRVATETASQRLPHDSVESGRTPPATGGDSAENNAKSHPSRVVQEAAPPGTGC